MIQLLLHILRIIDHTFQFNSSTEGSISECLFGTAHNAFISKDIDVLKLRLTQYDIFYNGLTHWGRVTHICVGKSSIIGSDNGLSPGRRQAIIWINAGMLLIGPLGTNFSEILIEILTFSFKKMRLKVSSAKWRPLCLSLNVLKQQDFSESYDANRCNYCRYNALFWFKQQLRFPIWFLV